MLKLLLSLNPFVAIPSLLRIARERELAQRQRTVIGSHWQMGEGWVRQVEDIQGECVVTYTRKDEDE